MAKSGDHNFHFEQGVAKLRNGEYEEAIANFEQAIELHPEHDEAWGQRGIAKFQIKDYPGALEDLTHVIRKNLPDHGKYLYYLARVKAELEDYEGAIEDYTKVIDLNQRIEAYHFRGFALFQVGAYEESIEDMDRVVTEDANSPTAYFLMGIAYNKLRRFEEAIENITKAIALKSKDAFLYYRRGQFRMNLAKENHSEEVLQQAKEDFDQALKIKHKDTDSLLARANCYDEMGRYQEAINDYDRCIKLDANNGVAYFNRGLAKIEVGDKTGACEDWRQALKLGVEEAKSAMDNYC